MRPSPRSERARGLRVAVGASLASLFSIGILAQRTEAAAPEPPGSASSRDSAAGASGVRGGLVVPRVAARATRPLVSRPLESGRAPSPTRAAGSAQAALGDASSSPAERPRPSALETGAGAPGDFVGQWAGLGDTGRIPADTALAVGPTHVVQAVNTGFSIHTKLGTQLVGYTPFESFLNLPPGFAGFVFGPRLVFDSFHQKFVMLVLGKDEPNLKSYYWLAVSQTSDPTAGFWVWQFDATATVSGALSWMDNAGLATDNWGVYVTGDYFTFPGTFRASTIWSVNPAVFAGGDSNSWRFLNLRWPTGQAAVGIAPAQPHSESPGGTTYFVNTFNTAGNQVLLWKLTGDRTNSPTLTSAAISTESYDSIGDNVGQPGTATPLEGGDSRVASAVYYQGKVAFVLTDDVNANGDASGWLTVKLDVATNTNEWQHLLWGGVGTYYFHPALTVLGGSSPDASLAVFGNWTATTAPTQFASGLYKIYEAPPATTGPLASFADGYEPYVRLDASGRNRFGRYSAAAYDWSCGHVWGAVEAAGTGNTWRTEVASRQFGAETGCPLIEVDAPNGGEVWNAGTAQAIVWRAQDLGGSSTLDIFFDPGTGEVPVSVGLPPITRGYGWVVPGTPTLTGRVRVANSNGTSYEASDLSNADFRITAPDLQVVAPSASSSVLTPGETFTVEATVANGGDGSSNVPASLRYLVSTDADISTADTEVGTDTAPTLDAGASSLQSATLSAPGVGTYWVGACVDPVPAESNAANQCSAGVPITVTRPDLVVSAIDAPASARPGEVVSLAHTVLDQGAVGTGVGFSVAFYFSPDAACNSGDTLVGTRAVAALAAGASSAASTSVTIPSGAAVGSRFLCAVADSTAAVAELDEANNIGTDSLQILPVLPIVNLKVNGIDAVLPAAVTTPGPLRLTLDMTPGTTPLSHYFAILLGGNVYWVTSAGVSTTPAPLATFTPASLTNVALLDVPSWSPGTSYFVWLMLNGGTVVGQDVIQVNVIP